MPQFALFEGDQMNDPFIRYGLYLAGGAVLLGLLLYLRRKLRLRADKIRLEAIARQAKTNEFIKNDPFYCIMLQDGTTRAGFRD